MKPTYFLHESTIREYGESTVLDLRNETNQNLVVTLGITHALEQESLIVNIHGSNDGQVWTSKPVLTFPQKFYCGTYRMLLHGNPFRFLKAVWSVDRWGRGDARPFFRMYLSAEVLATPAVMVGAA